MCCQRDITREKSGFLLVPLDGNSVRDRECLCGICAGYIADPAQQKALSDKAFTIPVRDVWAKRRIYLKTARQERKSVLWAYAQIRANNSHVLISQLSHSSRTHLLKASSHAPLHCAGSKKHPAQIPHRWGWIPHRWEISAPFVGVGSQFSQDMRPRTCVIDLIIVRNKEVAITNYHIIAIIS